MLGHSDLAFIDFGHQTSLVPVTVTICIPVVWLGFTSPCFWDQAQLTITFPWICQTQGWAREAIKGNRIPDIILEKELTI